MQHGHFRTESSPISLHAWMLKELTHHPHHEMSFLSDADNIVDDSCECLVKVSKRINVNAVCRTKASKNSGKIKCNSLREGNVILVNIQRLIKCIQGSKKKLHDIDKEIELMNILGPKCFDFIIVDNAFRIVDNQQLSDNLFKVWD